MAKHLDSLARELSCSICLSVMSAPVARLPCCHYFCLGCIQQSVKHKPQCPVCKAKVGRRELRGDGTMDRVVQAFAELEACKEELLAGCSTSPGTAGQEPAADGEAGAAGEAGPPAGAAERGRRPQQSRAPTLFATAVESLGGGRSAAALGRAPGSGGEEGAGPSPDTSVRAPAAGGICWLAGVDNEEYRSPSVSYANSGQRDHQRGRPQQQQEQQQGGPDERRLSLLSVQAAPAAAAQPAGACGKENVGSQSGKPGKPPQGAEQKAKGRQARRGPAQLDASGAEAVVAAREEGEADGGADEELAASGGAGAAELPSPGLSSDIQGLAQEVAAAAAAVAAAAPSDSGGTGSGAAHLTPPQPAQAAAPTTHKVPAGEVGVGAALHAQRGGSAAADRKRASNAAEAAQPAGAGSAAAGTAAGGSKRRKRASVSAAAAGRAAGSAAAAARRRSAPAAAAAGAAATAVDAATPGPLLAAGAAGAASAGGEGGSRRRIPARLLPWNCAHCTFENQGAAHKCDMCGLKKKVLPGAELATLAGGTPATAVAAAAERLQRPSPGSEAAGRTAGMGGKGPAAGGGGRQRKMSSGGPGPAGGSGKRRRVAEAAAAAAPSPAEPSVKGAAAETAAAAPPTAGAGEGGAPASWRDRSGSGSWVLLGSLLAPAARSQLHALAQASGASLASEWSAAVTHVVCGTADGAARRTYKYLRGVLAAQAVVTDAWLAACLAAGGPVDEAAYLVARERGGEGGGAAAARASAALGLPPLLHGFEVFMAGKFCKPGEVAELLAAAGAKRLTRPPAAAAAAAVSAPCTAFLLCDTGDAAGSPAQTHQQQENEEHEQGGAAAVGGGGEPRSRSVPPAVAAAKWYQRAVEAGVPVVSHRWLLDSISSYTVKPLPPYRVGGGVPA